MLTFYNKSPIWDSALVFSYCGLHSCGVKGLSGISGKKRMKLQKKHLVFHFMWLPHWLSGFLRMLLFTGQEHQQKNSWLLSSPQLGLGNAC